MSNDEQRRIARHHANKYVQALLAGARIQGIDVELMELSYDVDARFYSRWRIAQWHSTEGARVDSDGWVELIDTTVDEMMQVRQRVQRVRLDETTYPMVAKRILVNHGHAETFEFERWEVLDDLLRRNEFEVLTK